MDTSITISICAISICIHTTALCPQSNVEYAPISIWDATISRLGHPKHLCLIDLHAISARPIESPSIWSSETVPARLPEYSTQRPTSLAGGHREKTPTSVTPKLGSSSKAEKEQLVTSLKWTQQMSLLMVIMRDWWPSISRPQQMRRKIRLLALITKQLTPSSPCLGGAHRY